MVVIDWNPVSNFDYQSNDTHPVSHTLSYFWRNEWMKSRWSFSFSSLNWCCNPDCEAMKLQHLFFFFVGTDCVVYFSHWSCLLTFISVSSLYISVDRSRDTLILVFKTLHNTKQDCAFSILHIKKKTTSHALSLVLGCLTLSNEGCGSTHVLFLFCYFVNNNVKVLSIFIDHK